MIALSASGAFGATANNKRVKLVVGAVAAVVGQAVSGGTTIADTGVVTTNGGGWNLSATIAKYGQANSNTQTGVQGTSSSGTLASPAALTLQENAPIIVAVTGNAATATTDIALNLFRATAAN